MWQLFIKKSIEHIYDIHYCYCYYITIIHYIECYCVIEIFILLLLLLFDLLFRREALRRQYGFLTIILFGDIERCHVGRVSITVSLDCAIAAMVLNIASS